MTTISVVRKAGHIVEFTLNGHTGAGDYGKDVVCAALSAVAQTALLGLKNVAKLDVRFIRDDDKGFLHVIIDTQDEDARYRADIIAETMMCGIKDLAEGYPQYIKLEEK